VVTNVALIRAAYERPTISASRLKSVGGEKGKPGCERKLAGHYLFGLKQAETDALRGGTALHEAGEVLQATGEVPNPESPTGRILRSGAHLISQCGDMLVEYEHVGTLPDGSPYLAFLDGHLERADPLLGSMVYNDLKTCGNPAYALVADDDSDYALKKDIQVMKYAWILLCDAHWYCPPLPSPTEECGCDGWGTGCAAVVSGPMCGPKHWRWWDPVAKHARVGRPRWLYFLTKGNPRAWEVTAFVSPAEATAFMHNTILPLVARINAIHEWHYANPSASLNDFDRNFEACRKSGMWCGVGEAYACNFEELGTPILDLIQLKVRPKMTPQERLNALMKNRAAGVNTGVTEPKTDPKVTAPPGATPAPAGAATSATAQPQPTAPAESVAVVAEPSQDSAPSAASAPSAEPAAPKRSRGRPPKPPVAPLGAGVNPPEVVDALATLALEADCTKVTAPVAAPAAVPTTPPPPAFFDAVSTERILAELFRRVRGAL
jgi:hypothetical protein